MTKRTMIAPVAMAKYLLAHTLLDRRNAFSAAFAAAFAAAFVDLESLILTVTDRMYVEAWKENLYNQHNLTGDGNY